ncbi:MAG: 30S ribosomal protein S16 [Deltaproteobacteria bacterium]|nr:30S ribosomal protein S16 [Deltaproteobacteria bacterium]
MPVAIRLRRAGSKKNAFFHVVAIDSRKARDGRFIELLGNYDPRSQPSRFDIKRQRLDYWLSQGARMSRTVSELVARSDQEAGPKSEAEAS